MMGSGAGVTPAGGLSDLAALVEVMRDPAAYQEKLAELGARQDKVQRYEAEVQAREVELRKRQKALDAREAALDERTGKMAEQAGWQEAEADRLRKLEESLGARAAGFAEHQRLQQEVDAALAEREAAVKKAEVSARRLTEKAEKAWRSAEAQVFALRDELAALRAASSEVASRSALVLTLAPAVEDIVRG
jgi:membrane protein involved in colicin uptake